ncbi:MAG: hypothetical protein ACTSWN_03680 [Promethearchaeota archaeon]
MPNTKTLFLKMTGNPSKKEIIVKTYNMIHILAFLFTWIITCSFLNRNNRNNTGLINLAQSVQLNPAQKMILRAILNILFVNEMNQLVAVGIVILAFTISSSTRKKFVGFVTTMHAMLYFVAFYILIKIAGIQNGPAIQSLVIATLYSSIIITLFSLLPALSISITWQKIKSRRLKKMQKQQETRTNLPIRCPNCGQTYFSNPVYCVNCLKLMKNENDDTT